MNVKTLKICLVASAGGHLTQLLKVAESWRKYELFYVSTVPVVADKLRECGRTLIVGECNRQQPLKIIKVFLRCVRVVYKERPDVLISTGAAAGCMLCFLGKLIGAKVIWIDSITNIERISLSGRMVRYIADLFLVQWPDIAKRYKDVEYVGAVI
jgi:UDP-N-acetylglucosamine:LPS N-acetylglucosamine transferase